MGSNFFVLGEGVPYHVIYPMTCFEQTDARENVSFPKLRLRVVMSDLEVLYSNGIFLALFTCSTEKRKNSALKILTFRRRFQVNIGLFSAQKTFSCVKRHPVTLQLLSMVLG